MSITNHEHAERRARDVHHLCNVTHRLLAHRLSLCSVG